MNDIKKLIKEYKAEAKRLQEYVRKLALEIENRNSEEDISMLELRKETIEAERYEILSDISSMLKYAEGE